jgi:protein O-GlcNAc transferase
METTQQKRSLLEQALHLQQAGKLNPALNLYQKLVRAEPRNAAAWANFATVLHQLGDPEKALAAINKAFSLHPQQHPASYFNKGLILQTLARYREALSCYETVLRTQPRDVDALNHAGICFAHVDDYDRAVYCFERALEILPNADAFLNAGDVYYLQSEFAKANICYRKSLALNPQEPASIYFNIGLTAERVYGATKALPEFEKALQRDPNYHKVYVPLLRLKQELCDWQERETLQKKVLLLTQKELAQQKTVTMIPFFLYSLPWDNALKYACVESTSLRVKRQVAELLTQHQFQHDKTQPTRLRIAYVSCDFTDHPIGHLTAGMFKLHDRDTFEVFVYSFGKDDGGVYRKKIAEGAEHFIDIQALSSLECAQRIHQDKIHILIDLTGHLASNRMEIFALKPAPIQISYLNTTMTTAADFYDYLIGDPMATPLSSAACFSEKLVLLPTTYWMTDNEDVIDEAPVYRADFGLLEEQFVYCCFNSSYKIEPLIFSRWMAILKATPGSVLWLLYTFQEQCDNLRREAQARGVDPERLIFTERLPRAKHLARLRLADLFLDTYYINAHTTASDALWAGLPVLACPGNEFVNRVTCSLLNAIGIPELLTDNLETYQALAIRFAKEPGLLPPLRQKLQQHRTTYPLFNTAQRVKEFEQAYQLMWQRFQQGLPVDHIDCREHTALEIFA